MTFGRSRHRLYVPYRALPLIEYAPNGCLENFKPVFEQVKAPVDSSDHYIQVGMPSTEEIQTLIEKRGAGVKAASERRDVDDLMSWHSKEATFVDSANGITIEGKDAIRAFYAQAYAAIPTFEVVTSKSTGFTPEFVAVEMECEGKTSSDLPGWGLKAGDTLKLKGVSLFWWKWEGEGEEWDGNMSETAIRGWKIVEEHAYHQRV